MCGIIGMIGSVKTGPVLKSTVDALTRLEYRGYDSFGVAVIGESIEVKKDIGSVSEKTAHGFFKGFRDGMVSVAHTRWATHGGVTKENAHPHVSHDGAFAVVHNGVIENYRDLKSDLEKSGVVFASETDTEVIAHILVEEFTKARNVRAAIRATAKRLKGEYALVIATVHEPLRLYGARRKSPLGVTLGSHGGMFASDQRGVTGEAREITYLEDGDVCELDAKGFTIWGDRGMAVKRASVALDSEAVAEKGKYPHFMIKEIAETGISAEIAFALPQKEIDNIAKLIKGKQITLTGAGSSFYVALLAQHYFAKLAGVYVRAHSSDELTSLLTFGKKDALLAITQSGETFDTLEAMRAASRSGALTVAITNVRGSSIAREANATIYQNSGQEVCVLSTKSIVSQSVLLYRVAVALGKHNGTLTRKQCLALSSDEKKIAKAIESVPKNAELARIGRTASRVKNWFFIGRGMQYPVALESALKFKEVSYLHAEGMPAGFFKHGTISMIEDGFWTMVFLPRKEASAEYGLTVSNVAEIRARGGKVIAIGHDDFEKDTGQLAGGIMLPEINEFLDPILELIAGQIIAYHCGLALGRNIDRPRALAKSVTVR